MVFFIKNMKIGQLQKKYGVDKRTIDFYTNKAGILPYKTIEGVKYRDYDEESEKVLKKILILREIGLSIEEIGYVLKNPSYFSVSKMQEHIEKLEKKREEEIERYNRIISYAKDMKQMGEMAQKGFEKEIDFSFIFDVYLENIKDLVEAFNSSFSEDEITIMVEESISYIFLIMRNKGKNIEIEKALNKWIDKFSSIKSTLYYICFACFSSIPEEYFRSDEDSSENEIRFLKELTSFLACWIKNHPALGEIDNVSLMYEAEKEQINYLDSIYQELVGEDDVTVQDLLQDVVDYEKTNNIWRLFVVFFLLGFISNDKICANIDPSFGKGSADYLCEVLNNYIDKKMKDFDNE